MGEDKNPVLGGDAAEAQAEEAFINEQEDAVNPLIDNGDAPAAEPADDLLGDNAVGSGNLEAPASTEPVNNEQTPAAEQPATSVVDQPVATATPADPAKKKKTGMIVGIIVAAVLLIGGIVGALIFVSIHESKEYIQADAFKKFFGVKLAGSELESSTDGALIGATQFNGTVDMKLSDEISAKLTIDTKEEGINSIAENSLVVTSGGKDYKLTIAAAYIKGGSFYLKLKDLESLRDTLVEYVGEQGEFDSEAVEGLVKDVFGNAISVLEDQWIVINADTFEEYGYKDTYSCIMDEYDRLAEGDQKKDLLKAYKDNDFLSLGDTVEKEKVAGAQDGLTYYKLEIDEDKLEKFGDAVSELDYSDRFQKCIDDSESGVSSVKNVLTDAEEEESDEPTVYLGIKGWSHEITHIAVKTEDDKVSASFNVGYDKQEVKAPENAKTVKELAESLFKSVKKTLIDDMDALVELVCAEYDDDLADTCKEYAPDYLEEYIDEMEYDDLVELLEEQLGSVDIIDEPYDDDWNYDYDYDDDWDYDWDE